MKHCIIALLMTIILVLTPVIAISATINDRPVGANASEHNNNHPMADQTITLPGHTITVPGPRTTVPGPKITVPGPRITIPGPTITVPGPRSTITRTVKVPGPTRTVRVEGPRSTVTIKPAPKTRTVRVPGPTKTVSGRETATVSPSDIGGGQGGSGSGTLDSGNGGPSVSIPDIQLSVKEVVGYGTLTIIFLSALIMLGMWIGYYKGFKDSKKSEANFLRSLLRRKG